MPQLNMNVTDNFKDQLFGIAKKRGLNASSMAIDWIEKGMDEWILRKANVQEKTCKSRFEYGPECETCTAFKKCNELESAELDMMTTIIGGA